MSRFIDIAQADVTRLILIRHGQTAANVEGRMCGRADVGLTPDGVAQVQRLAERLAQFPVSALYASPQLRARQTATILGSKLDLPVTLADDLVEYDFGAISELAIEEIEARYPRLYAKLAAWLAAAPDDEMDRPTIPGAEDIDAFTARMLRFRDDILTRHRGQVVAAVSHGAWIKSLLTLLAGGSLRRKSTFWLDPASLSVVDFCGGYPVIRLVNEIAHYGSRLCYVRPLII